MRLTVLTTVITTTVPADRPTLFIAENLVYYFPLPTIETLFTSLVNYFAPATIPSPSPSTPSPSSSVSQYFPSPSSPSPSTPSPQTTPHTPGQLVFDICGTLLKKYRAANLKNTTLKTHWAIDDAHDLEKFHPLLRLSGRVRWEEYLHMNINHPNGGPVCQMPPPLFGPWTQTLAELRHNKLFKEALQVLRFDFGGVRSSLEGSGGDEGEGEVGASSTWSSESSDGRRSFW